MGFDAQLFKTLVGPRIDASLSHDILIHRIVDFFAVAESIRSHLLYIPLATKFHDLNEGIERALFHYASSTGPCADVISPFDDKSAFMTFHRRLKKWAYVSSWSRESDSVALWSLYSKDECSVQISTRVGNLEAALYKYALDNHDPSPLIDALSGHDRFLYDAAMLPVKYSSLHELGRRIERRRRAYEKLAREGRVKPRIQGVTDTRRESERATQYLFADFSIKDLSFAHERELRAIIRQVAITPDLLTVAKPMILKWMAASTQTSNVSEKYVPYMIRELLSAEFVNGPFSAPDHISLPFADHFVEYVTIDPRCPLHKQAFMRDFFRQQGIPVENSHSFGYAGDHLSHIPRTKLN